MSGWWQGGTPFWDQVITCGLEDLCGKCLQPDTPCGYEDRGQTAETNCSTDGGCGLQCAGNERPDENCASCICPDGYYYIDNRGYECGSLSEEERTLYECECDAFPCGCNLQYTDEDGLVAVIINPVLCSSENCPCPTSIDQLNQDQADQLRSGISIAVGCLGN